MPERNNAGSRRLRVGLICDAPRGAELAAAIQRVPEAELVAVAGERFDVGEATAPRFDDPRALVVQGGVEAVVVAVATRAAVELAEIAAEAGVHVWRPPPLARSFAEAVHVASRRKSRPTLYRVASWWDHAAEHVLETGARLGSGATTMASLDVRCGAPPARHWSRRRAESGGGVVLNSAYDALLTLVALRGLPATVWSAALSAGGGAEGAVEQVEHACCAALLFGDGGLGTIRAAWDCAPEVCRLELVGGGGRLEVTNVDVHAWSASGAAVGGSGLCADYRAADVARFFAEVRGGRVQAPEALDLHLAAGALVESMYLSSVTGQPESPRKQYEVQQWPVPVR